MSNPINKIISTFILLVFACINNFSQFSSNDYDLVKTTATRQFDRDIINQYLQSNDHHKIVAAVLSVSHSNDTTFIDDVIKIELPGLDDYIAFCLGQLGPSQKSTNFLIDKIKKNISPVCFPALGNVADSLMLERLITEYPDQTGIPKSIINFFVRKITNTNSEKYLTTIIDNANADHDLLFEALYALYRIQPSKNSIPVLTKVISNSNEYQIRHLIFVLGSLRKLKYFPDNESLIHSLLQHDDWRIRTEAVRSVGYSPILKKNIYSEIFKLLHDENPNVARTAAQTIKILPVDENQLNYILKKTKEALNDLKLSDNTRGELFITLCYFSPDETFSFIDEYDDIQPEYIFDVFTTFAKEPLRNLEYLKDKLPAASGKDLIGISSALLTLQSSLFDSEEYYSIIFSLLSNNKSIPISIISYGLDSLFIAHHSNILQQIIIDQCFSLKDRPELTEAIFGLKELAKKMEQNFYQSVLEILSSSKLSSVAQAAQKELGRQAAVTKEIPNFDSLWSNAFNYKQAIVETSRGSFIINFIPEFAPVSVGNFCYLAKQNYFNDIVYHRVVPNFVIQTGDPTGTGWSGPGYEINSEFSLQPFNEAFVGMASAGKDTEGSQWFVMHSYYPHLDWKYSNFGKVISGMDVVNRIDQGDKIIRIDLK